MGFAPNTRTRRCSYMAMTVAVIAAISAVASPGAVAKPPTTFDLNVEA